MYLLAGLLAAVIGWFIKPPLLRLMGARVPLYLIPLIEEGIKTYLAFILGASLILTHGTYGWIEGIRGLTTWRNNGFIYGLNIFLGNIFFGFVTQEALDIYGSWYIAGLWGYVMHIIWHLFITKVTIKQ